MMTRRSDALVLPVVSLVGLTLSAGCQTHEPPKLAGGDDPAAPAATHPATRVTPPMDVEGELDSTWDYLAIKYDVDGDGRISVDEYGRTARAFGRLDRDNDGSISADDFKMDSRESTMRGMRGQILVARYFQDDDENNRLPVLELRRAVAVYDADGNSVIVREEFIAIAEDRRVTTPSDDSPMMQRMMADVDPWQAMLDVADRDGDEALSEAELVAFFDSLDDGDGVWALRSPGGGGGASRAMAGPATGEWAPDFTLRPPDGGGYPVQLKAFRNNLPVALIFGSYT